MAVNHLLKSMLGRSECWQLLRSTSW